MLLHVLQAGPSRLSKALAGPLTLRVLARVPAPSRRIATSAPVLSGHSRWSKIRHKKGAVDAARSQAWSRLMTDVHVALRSGTDPDLNPRLAAALTRAKDAGVPKDNIERAFSRAKKMADGSGKNITFEALGAGGKAALVVECVTDNSARTASRVKELLSKAGARISPVAFMFERKGVVRVSPIEGQEGATFDALFETALEGGAEDVREVETEDGMQWEVLTALTDLGALTSLLTSPPHDTLYTLQLSELAYLPNDPVPVTDDPDGLTEEKVEGVMKAVTALEDEADVVKVWTNIE